MNRNTEFQSEAQLVEKHSNRYRKKQQKTNIFKTVMRNKLLALENELIYF